MRSSFGTRVLSLLVVALLVAFVAGTRLRGQVGSTQSSSPNAQRSSPPQSPSSSVPVLKVTTHLVTVDVVATLHGQIVTDLAAKDFEIYEQVSGKKGQHEQKIAQFEFVTQKGNTAASKLSPKMPQGVYTNLIGVQRLPVPPTVLLVDGLNTDVESGMQARRQMVKMLASIPEDTPVAVFLLGNKLQLLQPFTKDPNLLREAAKHAMSLDNAAVAAIDYRDDPNSLAVQTQEMFGSGGDEGPESNGPAPGPSGPGSAPAARASGPPGGELQLAALQRFEKETYAANVDMRVNTTLDALRAIARHLSGYQGRKNLIWISSSFPLTIAPDATQRHNLSFEATRNYESQVASVTNALADAKVAVYPVNPSGVQTQQFFDVSTRHPAVEYGPAPNAQRNTLNRENEARFAAQQSMTEVAAQTGGKICVNNNDLADCVKTAVNEGSSYYELAYYPDASDWHGEFHKIVVKSTRPGVQLSFRQGYYARVASVAASNEKSGNDPQLQEAACEDLLTSTSVLVLAEALPPDQPKQAKYFLAIDSKMITFSPADGGKHDFRLDLGLCSIDRAGKPLQYLQDRVQQQLEEKEYAVVSARGVSHVVQFAPNADTARVRLVVRDSLSGRLGSVDIPYPPVLPPPAATKNNVGTPPAQP